MIIQMIVLALSVCSTLHFATATSEDIELSRKWDVKAWQSTAEYPTATDFPEMQDETINQRPNVGIAFTGGGSRSYLASAGYMAALQELDLVKNIRYIAGISGGSWFTYCYTFNQNGASDETLLGPIVNPEEMTHTGLQTMDPQCMRRVTEDTFVPAMLADMKTNHVGAGEAWTNQVQDVYMTPLRIPAETPVAWSDAQVHDIIARNPSLEKDDFLLPNEDRPFPIVGTTLVGPAAGAPYTAGDGSNRNFSMIEMTPMYVGTMHTEDMEYQYKHGLKHTIRVGGTVESFAFSRSGEGPKHGLAAGDSTGLLTVPRTKRHDALDASHMASASSFAIGAFVDTMPYKFPENASLHFNYWSPADSKPTTRDTLFADGGCYENILVTSMLQRRVEKIVLFFNVHTPLQPASTWDVYSDPPSKTQVARDLAAFFGVEPLDYDEWEYRGFDVSHNQVWPTDQWPVLITALQEAQAKGRGTLASLKLTSVENKLWGIPAGIETEVTFVYLSRLFDWESRLPDDLYAEFVPEDPQDAQNAAITKGTGPFKGFPHYPTICAGENNERANALADLTGWTIFQHKDLFTSILS